MRKKKTVLIGGLLAMSMTISSFAYTDVDDQKVATLSNYGIISGYTDNTFRPQNKITRAEFSAIITKTILKEDTEPSIQSGVFVDADGHWAKEYIYIVRDLNIASGKTTSRFAPDDNVTYEQAIKMIVAAIGYDDEAKAAGGYPNGYIKIAADLGIISGIDYNPKASATRLHIAQMAFNAMDCPVYFTYDENGEQKRRQSDMTLNSAHELKLHPETTQTDQIEFDDTNSNPDLENIYDVDSEPVG